MKMLIKFHASGGIEMLNKTLETITFQQRKCTITVNLRRMIMLSQQERTLKCSETSDESGLDVTTGLGSVLGQ